jgi:hypothetical protein
VVVIAGQGVCLANGCDCTSNCATLDLASATVESCLCLSCKAHEVSDLCLEGGLQKVWIYPQRLGIGAPISPTCLPSLGSCLQPSNAKGFICKANIAQVTTSHQYRWKTVQESLLGNRNRELKRVSKSELISHCQARSLPNNWEGTSLIIFCFPSMCMGVRGHAPQVLRCNTKACIRCYATTHFLEARHVTHPMVGVLLLKSVTRFSCRPPHTPSIT